MRKKPKPEIDPVETVNVCNEFSMEMLNAGWTRADIRMIGSLYQVSATDPYGRSHSGARATLKSLVEYLLSIGVAPPAPVVIPSPPPPPPAPEPPPVSDALAALLEPQESLSDGKRRLLIDYDTLTQRLHDERYEMSREETQRHEAISAILLELRG